MEHLEKLLKLILYILFLGYLFALLLLCISSDNSVECVHKFLSVPSFTRLLDNAGELK